MSSIQSSLDVKEWDDDKKAEVAAKLLLERSKQGYNTCYSLGYCVSEFLALINVTFQWFMTTRLVITEQFSYVKVFTDIRAVRTTK